MENKKFDDFVFTNIYEMPESYRDISFNEDIKSIECEVSDETKKFFCKEIENISLESMNKAYEIWLKNSLVKCKLLDNENIDYNIVVGIILENADDIYFEQIENTFTKFELAFVYKKERISKLCINYEKDKMTITIANY